MGDIKFIQALLIISLFAIAIIGYSIGFTKDNNSAVNIDQDSELFSINSSLVGNVSSFYLATSNSSESFSKTSITGQEQTTVTGGEFKLNFLSMLSNMGTIFKSINKNIFGGSPAFAIILTAFSSFLVYVGIRYIWKTWKGGNPD